MLQDCSCVECDMCDVVQGHVAQDIRSHLFYASLGLVRVFMIS